ncbi:hypothetical protein D3C76_165340 [compost metagenome]
MNIDQPGVTVIKTQAELIAEAVENAAGGCDAFNVRMTSTFPRYIVNARPVKLLGDNVQIEFANVADKSECSSGILMNASGYMRFLMQLNGNSQHTVAKSFDIEQGIGSYQLRDKGVKFRKIKGKTPAEALQKLAAWLEKNADAIKSL